LNGRLETGFEDAEERLVGTCIGPAGLGLKGRFDTGAGLLDDGDDLTGSVVLDLKGEETGFDGVRGLFGEVGFVIGMSKNGVSILGIGEPILAFRIAALVSASIGDASSKSPKSSSSSSMFTVVVVVNSSYGLALRMASRSSGFGGPAGLWRAGPDREADALVEEALSSDPKAANKS
jgi:hypothetical protein